MGNHRHCLPGLKVRRALGLLSLAAASVPAFAADCPTGQFRAHDGPDTASALEIAPNGRFRYVLSEGAVDEGAEGKWICDQGVLKLSTLPTPKPAEFRLEKVSDSKDADFALIVTGPDGRGVAAVDFRLEMPQGEPVTGYTQDDGWSRDLGDTRPVSVQVAEPFFGTVSPVFPLPQHKGIKVHIVLIPNDIGVAAFKDTPVTQEDDQLVLHWRGRAIPYRLATED